MIPAVFLEEKLICHGKISEPVLKSAIEEWHNKLKY
jgi:hypothetical protein